MQMKTSLIATIVVILVVLVGGCSLYGYTNNVRNEAVRREAALTAQYLDNQNQLSSYISGFYESVGVANLKSDKLDQILVDAVKGRYDEGGFGGKGGLLNAITEAYPQIDLTIYDKIVDYVSAGREAYKAVQSKLLDQLRNYDTWRQTGFVRSMLVSGPLHVPTDRLEARVGEKVYKGNEARDKMYQIVLVSGATRAYETGTMEPLNVEKK